MNEMSFTEEDKKNTVSFLNMLAIHAKFEVKTGDLIEYFKLLSYMQQTLLPKIEANIFEIQEVVEPEKSEESK